MITDTLDHWTRYFSQPVWREAFEFVRGLKPDAADGFTELRGRDLYARVMTYDTTTPDKAILEAHREYIDIQSSLVLDERIDWFPLAGLEPLGPYDAKKDATYYRRPGPAPASVDVKPGSFVVLFPDDAHMPKLVTDKPHTMRKVVIKVRLSLIEGRSNL